MTNKGKKHKNMDRTSAAQASYLDKKREEHKKQSAKRKGQLRLNRGGYRS